MAVVDTTARTVHPIVLVHGMMGFDHLGSMPYWVGIPEAMRAHGAQVHLVQVSAFNSSEVRGEQLLAQVQAILKQTGAVKVHLIGHSHGSHTARYVAGLHPELVASVTSVAGPNLGSETADWVQSLAGEHDGAFSALLSSGNALGRFINWLSDADWPQDAEAAMRSLSSGGSAAFNQRFPAGVPTTPCGQGEPEVQGVRYYAWSGVGTFYNALNPADYLMKLTGLTFRKEASDGLVGRCASHLGQVIRDDLPLNHFHAVNQFHGLVADGVDPVRLYVDHARRLKAEGL